MVFNTKMRLTLPYGYAKVREQLGAAYSREGRLMAHTPLGWPHFVRSGPHAGNCLCLEKCCFGNSGCKCRGCAGIGHAGCSAARVRARATRQPRASTGSSQRATATG